MSQPETPKASDPRPSGPGAPADSQAGFILRRLPDALQAYAQLARYDRPIGTWLLFWPCFWGVTMASAQVNLLPPWSYVVMLGLGAVAMRGAGCTYNDIVDRHLDAQVARTAGRPLPSGRVSLLGAWGFLGLQCLVGLGVLLYFSPPTFFWLGIIALGLVAVYPFLKRYTYWPQAWLGLTFNWGALMGHAAISDAIVPAALALYACGVFWTLGYDTIYAHQDREDDAIVGLKSTALLFGDKTKPALAVFYTISFFSLGLAGYLSAIGLLFWPAYLIVGWHLAMQINRLDIDKPDVCLQIFRSNRNTGIIIGAAFVLGVF